MKILPLILEGPTMTRPYSVNWLVLDDVAEVARLEAQIHTPEHRAGEQIIAALFAETADDGRNLSLGLYWGTRLVGFALTFLARNRREVASFFDAPVPADLSPDEPVLYVCDLAILPRHRRMLNLLANAFTRLVHRRDDLRSLCVEGFSTEEYRAFWTARARFLGRLGYELVGRFPFHDARLGTTMYWMSMRPMGPASGTGTQAVAFKALRRCEHFDTGLAIGELDITTDSREPALQWDALLALTQKPTVWQRFSYLHSWWTRAGVLNDLFIPAAMRNGVAVAIAPMQIEESRWLGRPLRRLTYMESPPEVSGVAALVALEDDAAVAALADSIVTEQGAWDSIVLTEQAADDPFMRALETRMRARHLPVSVQPGPPIPCISVTGSWNDYLAGRSAVFRERLGAAERGLAGMAGLRFETLTATSDLTQALERFTALEANAPDGRRDAVSASSANLSFFRELAAHHGEALGMQFGFLAVGAQDIAAVLGFASNHCFYPVHVTWDRAHAAHDAGLLVMARQLERLFDAGDCRTVTLQSRAVPARTDWATGAIPTVSLYGSRGTLRGWLLHAMYSVGKPRLRRLMKGAATAP